MTIRMKRRLSLAGLLVLLLITFSGAAQTHPNLERGFSPDKAYQMGEIDSVNLFNGNITLTIPLGTTSAISEKLSLGLTASYNSKLWEPKPIPSSEGSNATHRLRPEDESNAGFGWLVSLGRLTGASGGWKYQGPDGGIHDFRSKLHPSDPSTTGVYYTTDGTYLRLREVGSNSFVDFPDGIVQEYRPWVDGTETRYRLHATRDPHGNYFTIDYAVANEWTIKDQYDRKIIVQFASTPLSPTGRVFESKNLETAIDTITFPGFGGATSRYEFDYETADVRRGYCGQEEPTADDKFVAVPLLKSITLFHGTTQIAKYEAAYDLSLQPPTAGTSDQTCKAGTITSLKLPTQASIRWTYKKYFLPGDCRSGLIEDSSVGVATRTFDSPNTGEFSAEPDGTWTYDPALTPEPGNGYQCGNTFFLGPPPPGEMTNTVTSPTGDQTVHYFSVWQIGLQDGPNGEDRHEFGLPFSRRSSIIGGTRFLSTKTCQGSCSSASNTRRTTYVAYERDHNSGQQFDANRRMIASRTIFNDDANHYIATDYSDFDGVGHYRTAVVTGDFGFGTQTRSTNTNFNVRDPLVSNSSAVLHTGTYDSTTGGGFALPSPAGPWVLNTFSSVSSTEGTSSSKQYACFDPITGDLRANRLLAGATIASNDLVTVAERSSDILLNGSAPGFVTAEYSYGGDATPLQPTTKPALCDFVNATAATDKPRPLGYRTDHTYSYGVLTTSTAMNTDGTPMPFKLLDLDIDPHSGLAQTVRDTAGVATTYQYDASRRLTTVSPPGMAAITYAYTAATPTTRAKVAITQNSTTGSIKGEVHFDSMGRPTVEKKTVDSSTLRSRTTLYNAMGWRTSVSEWGSSSGTTFSNFDAFGRPGTIQAADGTTTTISYAGTREMVRLRSYRSPTGIVTTTVTERSDPFGRLVEVAEHAGPTSTTSPAGALVTTKYGYDVVDRLTGVDITPASGTVQSRRFVYDGRGLMTEETHPEVSSAVRYVYDSRGHATDRTLLTASAFDLKYVYDAAERIKTVSSRFGAGFRLSKSFDYGTSGTTQGRLQTAKRYNYLPDSNEHYLVTEDYTYDTNGRFFTRNTKIDRVNGATQTLIRSFSQSKTYNDVGLPLSITYPQCATCGSTARTIQPGYTRGLLQSIPGFIDNINYNANGMKTAILHSNGITDAITVPLNGMTRPDSISFEGMCTAPQVTLGPPQQSIERNTQVTLTPSVSGTSPQYQWSKRPASSGTWSTIPGAIGATLTINVPEETFYRVSVTNGCGTDVSEEVRVIVFDTPVITDQPDSQPISGGQSASLSVVASGTAPLSYQWYRGSSGDTTQPIAAPAGTQSSYTTPILWATTSYWVRVSNSFGFTNSQTAIITVQLATPAGLVATRLSDTQILVTWNASAGAGQYRLQRRSGSGFVDRTTVSSSTLQFTDTVLAGKTYVYRVFAEDSIGNSDSTASNQDLATTIGFTPVQFLAVVSDDPLHEILSGINALRLAADAGNTQLTWATLVTPPTPANGQVIRSSPVIALRTQLNAARVALGFPNWTFTTMQSSMRVLDITELQDALR